jgi:predicted dehydrogenase
MLRAVSIGLSWRSNELAAAIRGKSHKISIVSCYSRSPEKRCNFAEALGTGIHDSFEALPVEAGRAVEIAD